MEKQSAKNRIFQLESELQDLKLELSSKRQLSNLMQKFDSEEMVDELTKFKSRVPSRLIVETLSSLLIFQIHIVCILKKQTIGTLCKSRIDFLESENRRLEYAAVKTKRDLNRIKSESIFEKSQIIELESETKRLESSLNDKEELETDLKNQIIKLKFEKNGIECELKQSRKHSFNRERDIIEKIFQSRFEKHNVKQASPEKQEPVGKTFPISICVKFVSDRNDAQETWNNENFSGIYVFTKKVNGRPAYKVRIDIFKLSLDLSFNSA